ncbi:MAG TPA: ABC transporter permease [Spongiibacteraceae bacterium]|jgi:putative ABC transport system permease protein|nr:ABC transporter permease [Spongiibacteraceae bacterium]HUH38276.1 ABC transporter permease [Spongiibacteraceae bacterium]
MRPADQLRFCLTALLRQRFRSAMILLAMAIGVAAVLLLTALGAGARGYVVQEFASLGKDVLVMFPGRKETTGGMPPVMGTAARDITLEDAHLLTRRVAAVEFVAPLVIGSAEVSAGALSREVVILGTNDRFVSMRQLSFAQGGNLPGGDIREGGRACLIGETLRDALFGNGPALGQWLRIGGYRFQVVGILEGRGDAMGMNLSDAAIVPVASAQRLFNSYGLFRLLVKLRPGYDLDASRQRILATMTELHQGVEDVTLVSPDAMLETFDRVLLIMTLGVAAIGGISLLVAGVLIMNVMMISVSQRTREVGLLKALGADSGAVLGLFLLEAMLVTLAGALMGLALGYAGTAAALHWMPTIPFAVPVWASGAALTVALLTGGLFSLLPARRASRLQPVLALQGR